LDLRILGASRRIIRAIDLHSRKLAADHKITAPQLVALNVIAEGNPLSTSEIARRMHLSPSTVVGILDRLEAKEVILRQRSRKDPRLVLVELTDTGRRLVSDAPSPIQDRLTEPLRALPDEEQQGIAGALEKVVSLMEVREIDAAPILETGPILPESDAPLRKKAT
jgi:DNA-binding MarR family transcriptional regulator